MNKELTQNMSYEARQAANKAEFEALKKTLKCCPFCGQPVEMRNRFYGSSNYGSGSELVIFCSNCDLEMGRVDTSWDYEYSRIPQTKQLVEKWNTRV